MHHHFGPGLTTPIINWGYTKGAQHTQHRRVESFMGALRFFRSVVSRLKKPAAPTDQPPSPYPPKSPLPRRIPLTHHRLSLVVFIYFLPIYFFSVVGIFFLLARKGGILWPCSCLSLSLLFPAHFPTPIASSFSHGALRPSPTPSFQQIRR